MKTSSDLLWRLIRTMSSAEKLYFKRNFSVTQPGKKKIHLLLFDAIAALKHYDEKELLRNCAPGLNANNLSYQKHYLQKQICESLLQYENLRQPGADIYKQIQLVRMYRKKGLLQEAGETWKKAVTMARASESFALLNLLKTEFEKMVLFSSLDTHYEQLHSLFEDKLISYEVYAEMITLRDIYTETLLLKRKAHYDLDPGLRERVEWLLEKVNGFTPSTKNPTFWYGHYYRMSHAVLLYLKSEHGQSLRILKAVLDDWKKNSQFISSHGEYYVELLYMVNYAGILQGEYAYVEKSFNDPVNNRLTEPVQIANFEAIRFLALNKILNKTARYAEVKKLVGNMKGRYQQWEPLLNADLNRTVQFSLGIGFFVLEQFDDALFFTKRAIHWFRKGVRDEHTPLAHILLLLISYCMDNSRLFDATYRSTYSYFYKRKKKQPFETALVQCLYRSFYLNDSRQKVAEYTKALEVFEANKENVIQQMSVNIFNYPGWLMSRVQRIPYRTFVERKVKAEQSAMR